jgi:hypothetical protein
MDQNEHEDPIEEIYAIRRRISEHHGNDPVRLGEHYMEYQKRFADRLISRREGAAPRPASRKPAP